MRAPVAGVEVPLDDISPAMHLGIRASSNDRRFVLGIAAMEAHRKQRMIDDVDKCAHTDAPATRPPVPERCAGALPRRRRVYGCFAEKTTVCTEHLLGDDERAPFKGFIALLSRRVKS